MDKVYRKALYAGSFDPFTYGHLSILDEAVKIFDEVTIGIAVNPDKTNRFTYINETKRAIENLVANRFHDYKVFVEIIPGFVADYCKSNNINYLIRGLRGTSDYLYEERLAKINSELNPNLSTIYFRAKDNVVSSSLVRELHKHNHDVSKYVPPEIINLLGRF